MLSMHGKAWKKKMGQLSLSYMVHRSAPKEAQDRLRQGLPPHSGKVSKAASYL